MSEKAAKSIENDIIIVKSTEETIFEDLMSKMGIVDDAKKTAIWKKIKEVANGKETMVEDQNKLSESHQKLIDSQKRLIDGLQSNVLEQQRMITELQQNNIRLQALKEINAPEKTQESQFTALPIPITSMYLTPLNYSYPKPDPLVMKVGETVDACIDGKWYSGHIMKLPENTTSLDSEIEV